MNDDSLCIFGLAQIHYKINEHSFKIIKRLPSLFPVKKLLLQLVVLVSQAVTLRDSLKHTNACIHANTCCTPCQQTFAILPHPLPPVDVPPRRLIDSLAVSRIENRMQQLAGQRWCYPALLLITKHQAAKWALLTDPAGKTYWQTRDLTRSREVLHPRYMGIYGIRMSSILRWDLKGKLSTASGKCVWKPLCVAEEIRLVWGKL